MAKKAKKTEVKKEETTDVVKANKAKTPKAKPAAAKVKTIKKAVSTKKAAPVKTTTLEQPTPAKKDPLASIVKFLWSVKEKHLSDILHDLMTEKEIQEFAERIEILRQLQKWVTQRVIAKNLGISVTTVSRWSKVLQTGKQKIKKYL